jgi:hypothetical protein
VLEEISYLGNVTIKCRLPHGPVCCTLAQILLRINASSVNRLSLLEMMYMLHIVIIQFSIYLRAELNSQWPITESARMQTTTAIRQLRIKQTKEPRQRNHGSQDNVE